MTNRKLGRHWVLRMGLQAASAGWALSIGLVMGAAVARPATAQTFAILREFKGLPDGANPPVAHPYSSMRAEESVIIGATQRQERFLTCVLHVSDNELRHTPNSDERLTVVILEQPKFLEMRDAFHAHQTKLAFSSLQARRIYLSSRMLGDFETLLRCITHELGHFATQSVYEGNAERAADRMRQGTHRYAGPMSLIDRVVSSFCSAPAPRSR